MMDGIIEIFGSKYQVFDDWADTDEVCELCDLQQYCVNNSTKICEDASALTMIFKRLNDEKD